MIPILALNRAKSIWGEDSLEFKCVCSNFLMDSLYLWSPLSRPERWEKTPEAAASIPGVWGHMLTFLGGPRACIGYRFALVEYARPLSFRMHSSADDIYLFFPLSTG